jgi:hypothetical protein
MVYDDTPNPFYPNTEQWVHDTGLGSFDTLIYFLDTGTWLLTSSTFEGTYSFGVWDGTGCRTFTGGGLGPTSVVVCAGSCVEPLP